MPFRHKNFALKFCIQVTSGHGLSDLYINEAQLKGQKMTFSAVLSERSLVVYMAGCG